MREQDKTYESLKIPRKSSPQEEGTVSLLQAAFGTRISLKDHAFAEVEIDNTAVPETPIPKPQTIAPEEDERRALFREMRQLGRDDGRTLFARTVFYNKQAQPYTSKVFYKQAVFMKDFEDDFEGHIPFSSYFPYYQVMSFEQLRTYFTWRTQVRGSYITATSASYVFVYIYELLNNIGVRDPQEGLDMLVAFWQVYREYDTAIDKYVVRWLKDYHVYYDMPIPFKAFIRGNDLYAYYPNMPVYEQDTDYGFERFCAISKYDITQSRFYTGENRELIHDCIEYVIGTIRQVFGGAGIDFDELFFQPTKNMSAWTPFADALFFPRVEQSDRHIVLSENEVYICKNNVWSFSSVLTMESGKQLISYIIKQSEVALRRILKFKYKLSANTDAIDRALIGRLADAGILLESAVDSAVLEFYRERTKTVVAVDHMALSRIRRDALDTQEKLVVPEEDARIAVLPIARDISALVTEISPSAENVATQDGWAMLKDALTTAESEAIAVALAGDANIKQFADKIGVMLEVLADGINEKAMDCVGDNVLEPDGDAFVVYEEYRDKF